MVAFLGFNHNNPLAYGPSPIGAIFCTRNSKRTCIALVVVLCLIAIFIVNVLQSLFIHNSALCYASCQY